MTTPARITHVNRTTEYFAIVDGTEYKAVHMTRAGTKWQPNGMDRWNIYSHQGIHHYQRPCDPDKPTYKKVKAAVQAAIMDYEAVQRAMKEVEATT